MLASTVLFVASVAATEPIESMGKVVAWKSASEVCNAMGKDPGCLPLVTSAGIGVTWIGEISEMEFLFDEDEPYEWPPTGNVRVVVTWNSPDAKDFHCRQTYPFHMDDLKEVEARSLIVKKCK